MQVRRHIRVRLGALAELASTPRATHMRVRLGALAELGKYAERLRRGCASAWAHARVLGGLGGAGQIHREAAPRERKCVGTCASALGPWRGWANANSDARYHVDCMQSFFTIFE